MLLAAELWANKMWFQFPMCEPQTLAMRHYIAMASRLLQKTHREGCGLGLCLTHVIVRVPELDRDNEPPNAAHLHPDERLLESRDDLFASIEVGAQASKCSGSGEGAEWKCIELAHAAAHLALAQSEPQEVLLVAGESASFALQGQAEGIHAHVISPSHQRKQRPAHKTNKRLVIFSNYSPSSR